MSRQYLLTRSEIQLIIESGITEFNLSMDYQRSINYGLERLYNIVATNEARDARSDNYDDNSRLTTETTRRTEGDIREVHTTENYFTNEERIGDL